VTTTKASRPSHERPSRKSPRADGPLAALGHVARRSAEARERLDLWTARLVRETRKHPIRSVALALGAGFVLGGGLFSRLTARVVGAGLRIGLRMAAVPLMTQGLVALGDGLRAQRVPPAEVGDDASDSHSEGKPRRRTHEAQ
jgi:hypothetical protein